MRLLEHALNVVGLLKKIIDVGCLIMYPYKIICSLQSLKGEESHEGEKSPPSIEKPR